VDLEATRFDETFGVIEFTDTTNQCAVTTGGSDFDVYSPTAAGIYPVWKADNRKLQTGAPLRAGGSPE